MLDFLNPFFNAAIAIFALLFSYLIPFVQIVILSSGVFLAGMITFFLVKLAIQVAKAAIASFKFEWKSDPTMTLFMTLLGCFVSSALVLVLHG